MKQDNKNYKVRCVGYKSNERFFTIGKVYDVVDGEITNDRGYTYVGLRDVIKYLSYWYQFEKINNNPISRVIFNDPATIILWTDGSKTVAKAHGDDDFDPEKGFAVACAKKLLGDGDAFRAECAKWIPIEDKRPNIGGFKVGERVEYKRHLGTVIALAASGRRIIGVEFEEKGIGCHDCGGIPLMDGHRGTKSTSKWLEPYDLNHVKEENLRLTNNELRHMQGQKVWLVSLDEDGVPDWDEKYSGWHMVKGDKLYAEYDDGHYNISSNNEQFGFHAYRKPPKK